MHSGALHLTHTNTLTHTHILTYTHICIRMRARTHANAHAHIHMHTHMHTSRLQTLADSLNKAYVFAMEASWLNAITKEH